MSLIVTSISSPSTRWHPEGSLLILLCDVSSRVFPFHLKWVFYHLLSCFSIIIAFAFSGFLGLWRVSLVQLVFSCRRDGVSNFLL